jgi:DNA-binding LacI/PurR family transcriptional regulator
MKKLILAAAMLALAVPAMAQEATRVLVPEGTKPCAVVTATSTNAKEQIRRLKRQGYLVTVRRGMQPPQIVSEGGFTFPMNLSRARVAASGC